MARYYYRGTSLSSAVEEELGDGRIDGFEANIYRGELDMHDPQATVTRGTPVEDIQWFTPEGEDRGYLTETQGVTGGLTNLLGAAIGFASGVPLVLYLRRSALNGTAATVRYGLDWFDGHEGALAWVYGRAVDGEIRTPTEGLMGLTTMTESGPEVWEWGHRQLDATAMTYDDEHEAVVFADHIDIADACESVAITLEGRRSPAQALATFDGYHAGYGADRETDISRWSDEELLATLHREVRAAVPQPINDLWTLNLSTHVMESVRAVPEEAFDFAYSDGQFLRDYDAVPDYLLGR